MDLMHDGAMVAVRPPKVGAVVVVWFVDRPRPLLRRVGLRDPDGRRWTLTTDPPTQAAALPDASVLTLGVLVPWLTRRGLGPGLDPMYGQDATG